MKTILSQWLCLACISASLSVGFAVEPRLFYDFNAGTGTSAYGAKSNPVELLMLGPSQEPLSLYGEAGSGLTGKPGDFALDIGKTTQAMGAKGESGGVARIPSAGSALGAMTSFTVTGWFKAASKLDGAARFVEYSDPTLAGFMIFASGPGMLTLAVNKQQASMPRRPASVLGEGAEGQWVFFAVTYDGSKTAGNAVFYGGTPTSEPQAIATEDLAAGKTAELNRYGWLTIGNTNGGIRPFHGMLDDIAIYASESDGSGALSAEQIIEIYHANLAAAPSAKAGADAVRPLKIAIIGDSTVCEYPSSSLLRGWGQMLRELTAPGVLYLNEAQGGKSSKSFPVDRWQKILAAKPDFVLIQFGHNDAHGAGQPESTDAATDYKDNLRRYVNEARAASITPVLVTPPHRRQFASGHVTTELAAYAEAMKAVAEELKVPLIDLYGQTGKWLDSLGEEGSASVTVNRGPNPAADDRSHFTKDGAAALAKFVAESFPAIDPRLNQVQRVQ